MTTIEKVREIVAIPLDAIRPDPEQPRQTFEVEALSQLADSILTHGQLQAIEVRPDPDVDSDTDYLIVQGERRYRACRLAQLPTVDAVIIKTTESVAKDRQLLENVIREDLNPVELAGAYRRYAEADRSLEETANAVKRTVAHVREYLRMLDAIPEALALIERNQLSPRLGAALADLTPAEQRTALRRLSTTHMTVPAALDYIQAFSQTQPAMFALDDDEEELEEERRSLREEVQHVLDQFGRTAQRLEKLEKANPGGIGLALLPYALEADNHLSAVEKVVKRYRRHIVSAVAAMKATADQE